MRINPNYQPPSCRQILHDIDDIAGQRRFLIYALDRLADNSSDRAHNSRVWLTHLLGGLNAQLGELVGKAIHAGRAPSPITADEALVN